MTPGDKTQEARAALAAFDAAARRWSLIAAGLGAATMALVLMRIFGENPAERSGLGPAMVVIAGAGLQLMLAYGPLAPVAERFRRLASLRAAFGAAKQANAKGRPDPSIARAFIWVAVWEAGIILVFISAMMTLFVAPPAVSGVDPARAPLWVPGVVVWMILTLKPLFLDIVLRLPAARALASGGSSSTGA